MSDSPTQKTHTRLSFKPDGHSAYDLIVARETGFTTENGKRRKVDYVREFALRDGRYAQVSKHGAAPAC